MTQFSIVLKDSISESSTTSVKYLGACSDSFVSVHSPFTESSKGAKNTVSSFLTYSVIIFNNLKNNFNW